MVKSVSLAAALALDSGFRRAALPLILLAASLFRYNIPSLLYFIFMLVSAYLPDSSKKKNRMPSLVLTILLALLSLFMTLAQPLFQISMLTHYDDKLEQCSSDEKIWRQFGFIVFNVSTSNVTAYNVHPSDVVRNYLPDVIVLVLSILSGVFLLLVHIAEKRSQRKAEAINRLSVVDRSLGGGSASCDDNNSLAEDINTSLISSSVMVSSEPNILHHLESLSQEIVVEEFATKIEGRATAKRQRWTSFIFAKLPILFLLSVSWKIFYIVVLWFSGICVACVLNFVYFSCSIYLSLGWALHLHKTRIFSVSCRVLVVVVSLFSAVHLVLLYLYQFQSAQDHVPRSSVTLRVLGITGIVKTDCNQTTKLFTHTREWPIYVNPISLLIIFWMSTSELRFYLFQTKNKSRKSTRTKYRRQEPGNHQSTKTRQIELQGIALVGDDEADDDNSDDTSGKKQIVWTAEDSRKIFKSMYAGMKWLLTSFMEANFAFSLIAMMVWSVLFPSWTSFVLLIWSCVVWVTPKSNAKDAVYYSTPILVLYAIVLLLIQYLYNLDLTEGELESYVNIGLTRYNSPPEINGARVLVIAIKSLCTAVFLSTLFKFILLHKRRWYAFLQRHCSTSADVDLETGMTGVPDDDTSPTEPVADQPDTKETSLIAMALHTATTPTDPYKYLKKYWIIVTTGAFLLVILVGEVTLLKVVFMVFFLLFIFAYEFFPCNWYRIMEPLWTILIFYAFIELTVIYTYQFSYIGDVWINIFNSSRGDLSTDEILESIGFFKVSIGTLSFERDLFVTIVPSAVFVAVMALQLKYFSPCDNVNQRDQFWDLGPAEHRHLSFVGMADQPSIVEGTKTQEEAEDITTVQNVTDLTGASTEKDVKNKNVLEKYWAYLKITSYLIKEFLWRLLEIYLPKVIIFVIFAVLLDEISATHFLVLLVLIVTIPMDINAVMFLILTGLIGNLTLLKMLYQMALVDEGTFNFSNSCSNITNNIPPPKGAIYQYGYTRNDPGWLGFQKVECEHCKGFFDYIKWDIVVLLLIALSYAVNRRQKRYFSNVKIPSTDKRALFWGITLEEADRSALHGLGYLINHIFDFYGLEICWSMFAIAVAVRPDVFGVVYAFALGVFLLTPHKALQPVWLLYLVIHACLLLLQYAMLVGVPYGACIDDQRGTKTLPWSGIEPVGLKRWLWLPIASNEFFILNRNWLWADLLIYVVMSFQFRNLSRKSLDKTDASNQEFLLNFITFATSKVLADHVKRITYKHFFWVTLFFVLVAGVSQVSILGLLYMMASFLLLWQGQMMLRYRKEKLRRWWFLLLQTIWCVLLVKVSLQLYTCVYFEKDARNDCIVVKLFNVRCEAPSYYGTYNARNLCSDLPKNIGLWLDTLAFVVVVFQIIIFSTSHFESIRAYLLSKESLDQSKRATSDLLDKVNEELEKEREKEKLIKENIKKRLLEVQDKYKTSVVEHYLRAGVQLPDDIEFNDDDDQPIDLKHYRNLRRSDVPVSRQQDEAAGSDDVNIPEDEIVRPKVSPEGDTDSKDGSEKEEVKESTFKAIWKLIGNGLSFVDSGFVLVINYLRARSKYYRHLSKRRKQRKGHGEDKELKLMSSQPMEQVDVEEDMVAKLASTTTTTEIILETAEDPPKQPSLNTYDAAITDAAAMVDVASQVDIVDDDDELPEVEDGLFQTWDDVTQVWKRFIHRPLQFLLALYYAALANTEYVCYFLIIINVIVNGSVLSLIYVALMFLWGLLSIPWPTKRFWLTLMFYTMFVMLVKYGFQFEPVVYTSGDDVSSGLYFYWPPVLGIKIINDFFENIVWDILLLISLFFHRSMLIVTGRWTVGGNGYFDILSFTKSDGTNAIQLIFRPRDKILKSLSGKNDSEEKEVDKPSEQEVSKSLSEVSSSEEDDSSEPGFPSYIFKVILLNIKFLYRQIITPDISLGAHDYYTVSFLMDVISFIIIVIGAQSFGLDSNEEANQNGVATAAGYIQNNNIPAAFVVMLFAHFMSMIIDRAIYLRKSVLGKLIFFLFQLVAWHVWLFFILPLPTVTAMTFTQNRYAQALYFFKCQYFIFSAQQCVSNYPKRILGYFISKRYNFLASLCFQGYRAIPILPDLKEVMDWMFTDTSLKLFHWLKVQEIWAQLYIIKNLRKREKNNPRELGQREGFVIKLLLGGGFLVLLILLIWGPLLLMALENTTNVRNPPVEVSIQLTIESFAPLLSISAGRNFIEELPQSEYYHLSGKFKSANRWAIFRNSHRMRDFTFVTFHGNSTSLWDISPPSRDALQMALNPNTSSNHPIRLIFSWRISRELDATASGLVSEVVFGQQTHNLQNSTRVGLYRLLTGATNDSVMLTGLYPPFINAPANGPSKNLSELTKGKLVNASINIRNRAINVNGTRISQEWWVLENISDPLRFSAENSSNVTMVFYSESVFHPIFSFFASQGIIWLYLSVMLVIGRAFRSYIAALPSRITFDEIPNPDSLLELCDDIFYVREDGNLQQEEILVGRLFFIFRSSARLIQQTKWKGDPLC